MGGHRFQMGGRAPLTPPLATALPSELAFAANIAISVESKVEMGHFLSNWNCELLQ